MTQRYDLSEAVPERALATSSGSSSAGPAGSSLAQEGVVPIGSSNDVSAALSDATAARSSDGASAKNSAGLHDGSSSGDDAEGNSQVTAAPAPKTTAEALLEAAALEFAQRGYEGTKIRHIVERAGLTTGAVYRQFKNKNALLRAAVVSRATTNRLDASEPSEHVRVADYLLAAGQMDYELTVELLMVLEAFVCSRRVPDVAEAIAEANAVWVNSVRPLLKAGVTDGSIDAALDVDAIAILFRILGLGTVLYQAAGLPKSEPEAWNALVSRLVDSLRPRPADA